MERQNVALYLQRIPLDEYLMYFTFMQTPFYQLPELALQIINNTVSQRQQLLEAAVQVELCVSTQDIQQYENIKNLKERLTFIIKRITSDEELFILARLGKNEDG